MKKVDMVNKLVEKMELTKKESVEIVDSVIEMIKDGLLKDGEVDIYGLGKFGVKEVGEKTGIIQLGDRKGETYTSPAHKAPTFKFSKAVKDLVR